jgi:glycosyltransferase involved in cell wall biosynthesis
VATTGDLVMVCDVDLSLPDGRRTHVTEVARGFAAHGLAVQLVSRGDDPGLAGVRYHEAAAATAGRPRRILGMNVGAKRALLAARHGTRRLYVREDWGTTPAIIAARVLGYRVVLEINDLPFGRAAVGGGSVRGRAANAVKAVAARLSVRCATGVVVISDRLREIVAGDLGYPQERIRVIPNGVDTARFRVRDRAEAAEACGLDPALRYIVFVGILAPWTDIGTAAAAFARIAPGRPDLRLVVVGDGDRRAEAEAAILHAGIAGQTIRTGFVRDSERVAAFMSAASVGIVPQRIAQGRIGGGSPVKLAEYLACGRAVVATDHPGSRGLLDASGAGIAVPPEDAVAFADALAELLDDQARADALGLRGRELVERDYSWNSVVERTLPLFDGPG